MHKYRKHLESLHVCMSSFCHSYVSPVRFTVFDEWASQIALSVHLMGHLCQLLHRFHCLLDTLLRTLGHLDAMGRYLQGRICDPSPNPTLHGVLPASWAIHVQR
jgi:hypothetical protein